jgi:hypothetical protein
MFFQLVLTDICWYVALSLVIGCCGLNWMDADAVV